MPDLPATRLTPALVPLGGSYDDRLETAGDRDWIGVDLVAGQSYRLSVAGRGGAPLDDPEMRLFDPLGGQLAYNDDSDGLNPALTYTAVQTGRHFIEVAGFGGDGTGDYRVSAAVVAAPGPLQALDWGTEVSDPLVRVYFAPAGTRYEGYTAEGFNAYEIGRFQAAFARIEAVTHLRFEVVTSQAAADFRLLLDTNQVDGEFLGYFNPPGTFGAGIGVFDGAAWDRSPGGDLEAGGTGFATITHELLHGLGLAHPHDTGGSSGVMSGVTAEFDSYGSPPLNQGIYTTMSYNSGWFTGPAGTAPDFGGSWGQEAGPMALDIALLQQKYGANMDTATGNDIYVLDPSNGAGTHWAAIWDAGGYDEIRAPDDRPVTIDLRRPTLTSDPAGGGYVSHVEGVAGGFVVAADVVIEVARGGAGDDILFGNFAANVLRGGPGADQMNGGFGNDIYFVDNPGDQISGEVAYSQGGGIDTVRSFIDYTQPENIELVRLSFLGDTTPLNATGNDAPGTLVGNAGANRLTARGGDDQVNGNAGDDILTGNTGRDTLVGGAGEDTFVYTAYADSRAGAANRDVINGFDRGADLIDLALIDADTTRAGNQAFRFIGEAGFSGAGQLRLQSLGGADAVLVEADHNGDGLADLQIFVNLTTVLEAGDFLL